jgi:hypothetical protein
MTQAVCQTRNGVGTEELSQAAASQATVAAEDATVAAGEAGSEGRPQQLVLWECDGQQVTVDFSADRVVTDTGLLAVRKLDRELGILAEAAARLRDPRHQLFVVHDAERLLVQQVYQLLGGYFDANDADVLRDDPLFQTLADRSPKGNQPLASGSTLSRFKYAFTRRELKKPVEERTIESECQQAKCQRIRELNKFLVELFVKTRRTRPQRIVIDLDASDDETHGGQQLSLFHGFYEQWQYLPLLAFEGESGFPLAAWLRPGTAHPSWGAREVLQDIVPALRAAFPGVEIVIRADTGFAIPEIYEYAEAHDLKYVIGYASNDVLERETRLLQNYVTAVASLHDEPVCRFQELRNYQAESWTHPRRIIAKCEITEIGKPNRRFVVTTLNDGPRDVYHDCYVKRGNYPERGIQELKHGLAMDRLSSHRFLANAFTLQCHVLALAIWTLFREANARDAEIAHRQLMSVRPLVFKVGALVKATTRRVWFHLSSTWPSRDLFVRLCLAVADFTAALGRLWPPRRDASFHGANRTGTIKLAAVSLPLK